MRYRVFTFPLITKRPLTTDFRLVALAIAFVKQLLFQEVCVIDSLTGEILMLVVSGRHCAQCRLATDLQQQLAATPPEHG